MESGRISGKLLITRRCLSFCYQKEAKKKRQTFLLRSLELNIFKNSDKILEQKQNRHFLKNSSIVDRRQSQKKLQNYKKKFKTEFRRTSDFIIQQFI